MPAASSTRRCGSTRSSSTRCGLLQPTGGPRTRRRTGANLAFRNLTRANMVKLATGQQMVDVPEGQGPHVTQLTNAQIRDGNGGADARRPHARSATRFRRTRRSGSTCSARPSSTAASSRRRRPHRRRDVPPRDEGSDVLDRARPGIPPQSRPEQHDLPDGRPPALRLRRQAALLNPNG